MFMHLPLTALLESLKAQTATEGDKLSYQEIANRIGALVEEKNKAYGSSFAKSGEFLRLLYPDGIRPDQYADALLLVRIFDKQMRIATAKDALDESPYQDIAGYGILGVSLDQRE